MDNDRQDDGVVQTLRLGRFAQRALPDAPMQPLDADLPLDGGWAMDMAAYLDGGQTEDEAAAFEAALLHDAARLELLLASRAALLPAPNLAMSSAAMVAPSPAVLQRAQALVRDPVAVNDRPQRQTAGTWLKDFFARPMRPAIAAAAFSLYGAFCLQVFDWGLAGGDVLAVASGESLVDTALVDTALVDTALVDTAAADAASVDTAFAFSLDELL